MTRTKPIIGALGAVALSLGVLTSPASAEDTLGYSVSITGTSDYIFRGISSNDEDPAFQPYAELTYNIFYLGAWGSNIADPLGPWETDILLGIRPTTGPISWDIGLIYYIYADNENTIDADYIEFKVGASASPVKDLTVGLTGYWTPDQDEAYPETWTIESSIAYALPQCGIFAPTISGGVGYSEADPADFFLGIDDSYTYWNAGLKLGVEKFFMDFRYWDTTLDDGLADERFVFTAGVTLP